MTGRRDEARQGSLLCACFLFFFESDTGVLVCVCACVRMCVCLFVCAHTLPLPRLETSDPHPSRELSPSSFLTWSQQLSSRRLHLPLPWQQSQPQTLNPGGCKGKRRTCTHAQARVPLYSRRTYTQTRWSGVDGVEQPCTRGRAKATPLMKCRRPPPGAKALSHAMDGSSARTTEKCSKFPFLPDTH